VDRKTGKRTLCQLWREGLAALAFFTRIPVPSGPWQQVSLAASMRMFPLIGAGVGAVISLAYWLSTGLLDAPAIAGAVIAVAAGILITGALHEDGLADFWDGFGGQDRTQRLAIMRDSHLGSYGAIALICILILRIAVISSGTPARIAGMLIAAAALSRTAAVILAHLLPPARGDGLSASAGTLPLPIALGATITGLLAALIFLPLTALLPALIAMATGIALLHFLSAGRLGGQTGDVLGATQQMTEALILISIVNISI